MSKSSDIIAGAVFLTLGLLLIFVLIPVGVDEPRKVPFAAASPSYYPKLIGYVIALIGAAILVLGVRRSSDDAPSVGLAPYAKVPVAMGIMAVFYLLLPVLGFIVGAMLSLCALMMLAGERSPKVLVLVSILLPLGLYLFFAKVAGIPIPSGPLEPYLIRI
ncbi:Tripartite tricarboxylate transporter TctB family protein [Falsiruegeria litorea R37]|uniref:Tripartite tricarboxylate transporter TctB family protein n=1 Tax=Falsiruegeria litorea R37 TaxID=1200284 RepID=A0A1Y5RMN9_9RHOB|nr:tripartite tricarboxylate transporter TctB family protein [Falsiruegeria litorea]SLN21036.1 Tripartite tricarboxylate transporter TctB family protein [Falsiruegeria litorea R37]